MPETTSPVPSGTTPPTGSGLQVRSRIILLTVSLAALALAVAGFVLWVSSTSQTDHSIDETLKRTVREFTGWANEAVDPNTGERYPSTAALLDGAMRNEVPAETEAIVAFQGGQLAFVQGLRTLDIRPDTEFLQHVSPITEGNEIVISTYRSPKTEYRFAVIPIQVGETPPGSLVLVFDRTAEHQEVRNLMQTFLWTSVAALSVATLAGWLLAGRMLRPIRELREVSATITERDLSRRLPVRGSDDLSELAKTFNSMVDRLESAFSSQRQLLDDAGHELRTPITVVRGHLELMDPQDPQDAADTRELAIHELDRMHRLADDLVLLAKTEQPDFVRTRLTDVGDMARETFDHMRRLGEREWRMARTASGMFEIDEQRIVQGWLQLAANAVKFSDTGTAIEVGSALVGRELQFWVRDSGIGITEDKLGTIFERFNQADASRGGAGLGLPIVAAIAHAHGGQVDVASMPGVGSTFVMRIPAAPPSAASAPQAVE
ncbi:MAG: HAMP domain-containing sensor histidine kinase [bacterium]|nr:HAMP domain-containing sensor histidine kinase [bacterium]